MRAEAARAAAAAAGDYHQYPAGSRNSDAGSFASNSYAGSFASSGYAGGGYDGGYDGDNRAEEISRQRDETSAAASVAREVRRFITGCRNIPRQHASAVCISSTHQQFASVVRPALAMALPSLPSIETISVLCLHSRTCHAPLLSVLVTHEA